MREWGVYLDTVRTMEAVLSFVYTSLATSYSERFLSYLTIILIFMHKNESKRKMNWVGQKIEELKPRNMH